MKKSEFEMVPACSIKVDREVWIYGQWLKVIRIKHLKWHPFQLYEFHFAEYREPLLRVPDGWPIRAKAKT